MEVGRCGQNEGGGGEEKEREMRVLCRVWMGEDTDLLFIQGQFLGQSNQHCCKANLAPIYAVGC